MKRTGIVTRPNVNVAVWSEREGIARTYRVVDYEHHRRQVATRPTLDPIKSSVAGSGIGYGGGVKSYRTSVISQRFVV